MLAPNITLLPARGDRENGHQQQKGTGLHPFLPEGKTIGLLQGEPKNRPEGQILHSCPAPTHLKGFGAEDTLFLNRVDQKDIHVDFYKRPLKPDIEGHANNLPRHRTFKPEQSGLPPTLRDIAVLPEQKLLLALLWFIGLRSKTRPSMRQFLMPLITNGAGEFGWHDVKFLVLNGRHILRSEARVILPKIVAMLERDHLARLQFLLEPGDLGNDISVLAAAFGARCGFFRIAAQVGGRNIGEVEFPTVDHCIVLKPFPGLDPGVSPENKQAPHQRHRPDRRPT